MIDLIGKQVEVITAETVYTGRLVEINENEVFLEAEAGWITIPGDRIVEIREKTED